MIYDTITNFEKYKLIIPNQQKIIKFINDVLDKKINLETDKIEIAGDSVFALINRYQTKKRGFWEAHKKYIDVQWMIKGKESILFANSKDLIVSKQYDEKNDYIILEGTGDKLSLSENKFAVFFPEDAHQPGIMEHQPKNIIKIVIKVKI